MRTSMLQAVLAVTLVAIACDDKVTDPVRNFESVLLGANEVPAVSTTAGANGTFQLVGPAGNDSVSYTLNITSPTGSAVTQAHIHTGNVGISGGISVWLCTTAGVTGAPAGTPTCTAGVGLANGQLVQGKMPLSAANIASMRAFGTYANIHTATHGTGEIRGQLRVVGQ